MRSRICSRLEARDCISSVVSYSTTTTSVSICGILRRSSSKQQLQCWQQDVEDLVVPSVRVFLHTNCNASSKAAGMERLGS